MLLAQPDPSDFKVMSHIIPCPNDIRHILKKITAVSRHCYTHPDLNIVIVSCILI